MKLFVLIPISIPLIFSHTLSVRHASNFLNICQLKGFFQKKEPKSFWYPSQKIYKTSQDPLVRGTISDKR